MSALSETLHKMDAEGWQGQLAAAEYRAERAEATLLLIIDATSSSLAHPSCWWADTPADLWCRSCIAASHFEVSGQAAERQQEGDSK